MKRLYRSREDKILGGICGGLGEYFDIDPTIIRFAVFLVVLFTYGTTLPAAIVAYLAAWLLIPENKGPVINAPTFKVSPPSQPAGKPPKKKA